MVQIIALAGSRRPVYLAMGLVPFLMITGGLLLQFRGQEYEAPSYLIHLQEVAATTATPALSAGEDRYQKPPKESPTSSGNPPKKTPSSGGEPPKKPSSPSEEPQKKPSPSSSVQADVSSSTKSTSNSPSWLSSLFEPGSLEMSRADTIRQCSVRHLQPVSVGCAYSPKHNFLLRYVGKTGSSTQRQVMKDQFEAEFKGQNKPCKKFDNRPGLRVVTTRDPVGRFISSVKEMFFRLKIFSSVLDINENTTAAAKTGNNSKTEYFESLWKMPVEYQGFYNIFTGLDADQRKALAEGSTNESLVIRTKAFETFLQDYDGKKAFDRHLELQVPTLFATNKAGTEHFDIVMDADNLTQDLEQLARRVKAPIPPPLRKRDSSGELSKAFAEDSLSDAAYQKICQLVRDDLCCLNYKMPAACQKYKTIPKGQRVMCEWFDDKEEDQKDSKKMIRAVLV